MPNLNQARERHTKYYLEVVLAAINGEGLNLNDADVANVREAWIWVSKVSRDPDQIIAFGEVAWRLFEATSHRLTETIKELEEMKVLGSDAATMREVIEKLDEIARTQLRIQSALGPNISAGGERSVAGTTIVNSTIITGDNVVIQKEQERAAQDTQK
ncbi:MAG: hypothetical protein IT331_00745 [Anaerolineae bacterium]|nr:hypothetical protein [Anaerolineae bacterium]